VRVALAPARQNPTSKAVAVSLKMLRRQSPGLRVVVSYADLGEGHVGTLYQAGGWIYLGASEQSYIKVLGKVEHPRSPYDRYGRQGQSIPWLQQHVDPQADRVPMAPKLQYAMPLDKAMRRQLEPLAKPYPKPSGRSDTSDTPGDQPGEGGATPTRPLQPSTDPCRGQTESRA